MGRRTLKEYNLVLEKRKSYLYAIVSGKDSMEASLGYWQEILDASKRLDYQKILIEEDLVGSPSTLDYFEFGKSLANMAQGRLLKIAFVDRHAKHTLNNKFAETVVTNRGVSVKLCKNIAEAEDWLLS
jgi:hypothetical protein